MGCHFYYLKRSIGGASFLIGNFVGVCFEQEVKCVKTKVLGQNAEEQERERERESKF